MQLVHQAHRGNGFSGEHRLQGHGVLRPVGQQHHHRTVHVLGRGDDGQQAEHQLRQQHQQDQDVRGAGRGPHAVIGQPALNQHQQADQAQHAEEAAGNHGQQLLVLSADDMVVKRRRHQQADKVPGQHEQHADVEQVAGDAHVALLGRIAVEHLAGTGLPGVLRQIKARPAADQADGQRDIGINPEHH